MKNILKPNTLIGFSMRAFLIEQHRSLFKMKFNCDVF